VRNRRTGAHLAIHDDAGGRWRTAAVLTGVLLAGLPGHAARAGDAAGALFTAERYKLTFGDYLYDDHGRHYTGQDLNLHYLRDAWSLWIGHYFDRAFGAQTRAGADGSWQPLPQLPLTVQPSLQAATQGFVGGALNAQLGRTWYGVVGWGRTNLRPYQNLNFDPNDAFTVGFGYHAANGNSFSLTTIHDDRLHTGQRHTHAVAQLLLPHRSRLTLDLLRKTGRGADGALCAWGGIVTLDIVHGFIRAAWDPKQNFGTADAFRISVGRRF
jgi:hypothetical protein